MPEAKSKFLDKILDGKGAGAEDAKSYTSERQHTAQAFNLHVERRDGRRAEGFAWSHYAGYEWTDEGSHERLVVVFGRTCPVLRDRPCAPIPRREGSSRRSQRRRTRVADRGRVRPL